MRILFFLIVGLCNTHCSYRIVAKKIRSKLLFRSKLFYTCDKSLECFHTYKVAFIPIRLGMCLHENEPTCVFLHQYHQALFHKSSSQIIPIFCEVYSQCRFSVSNQNTIFLSPCCKHNINITPHGFFTL